VFDEREDEELAQGSATLHCRERRTGIQLVQEAAERCAIQQDAWNHDEPVQIDADARQPICIREAAQSFEVGLGLVLHGRDNRLVTRHGQELPPQPTLCSAPLADE